LTRAEYLVGVQTQNEDFVYDKLGNRTTLKHNGTDVARYQHNDVNEYTYIGLGSGTNVTHDNAGNMTGDHDGYTYHYDYENRLTRVKKLSDTVDVAVYTYDALGRRIAVEDCIADTTTHYYYDGWRVLTETDENDDRQRDFAYGNYLDEALIMTVDDDDYYYAHDHLFSPVALIADNGTIEERYEYDAYGKLTRLDPDFTSWSGTPVGNPIFFTGQRLDELDNNNLLIMYYKNRYYLVDIGRFITHDPRGIRDGICLAYFDMTGTLFFLRQIAGGQYRNGTNLYEAFKSNSIRYWDTLGLESKSAACNKCGPDMTGFMLKLMKYTLRWFKTQRSGPIRGPLWLWDNAPNMVWASGPSTKGNEGIIYQYRNEKGEYLCPSGPQCKNTITLCGECVHDRWIGNFMFAFTAKLADVSNWVADFGADVLQEGGSDPPWDTAAYDIARNMIDRISSRLTEEGLCKLLKNDQDLWDQANDTDIPIPLRTRYRIWNDGFHTILIPNGEYPIWPDPIASGYKGVCEPCDHPPNSDFSDVLPGGGFVLQSR